ncbi:sigma-54 dependent transcriptional regulator [soil metagenome]
MAVTTILVVDDEPIIRETLAEFLQQERFAVQSCGSGEQALALINKQRFDVVLCDINLPGLDGLEVLDRILKISPETFVLLITAYATVDTAVEAFQSGAHDYLMKPVILREVLGKIRRLLQQRDLHRENLWLRRELNREVESGVMILGRSAAMHAAMAMARKVALTPAAVLVQGENGTGKELLARSIHRFAQASKPNDGRFLAVNCAAVPPEQLEQQLFGTRDEPGEFVHAGAGTLFLDEISELPLPTQNKLLRAIEQKEILPVGAHEAVTVQARIVAATNRELGKVVETGRFREDLFYRFNVLTITLPCLRERREDIPDLVEKLLAKQAAAAGKRIRGVRHDAMQLLLCHSWKGNVRELDNALQRAVILSEGPLIVPSDLPPDLAPNANDPFAVDDLNKAMERFERLHIERMLRLTPDKREAARRLDIGLSSLYRKIEQYGLSGETSH